MDPVPNKDGVFVPVLNKCTRVFQFILPFALGLGAAAIMTGVVLTHFIPDTTDPGLQAAGEITTAAGNSLVGLFGVTQWTWRRFYSEDDKDRSSELNAALYGMLFLLAASYLPGTLERFADLWLGLRIVLYAVGAIFSLGAVFMSVKMFKHYSPAAPAYDILTNDDEPLTTSDFKELNAFDDRYGAMMLGNHQHSRDLRDSIMEPDSYEPPTPRSDSCPTIGSNKKSLRPELKRRNPVRRLANSAEFVVNTTGIVSSIGAALASLLVWYLYLRGRPTKQDPPRRRTTIIKKRPTFVKGKRRATHKPTLSSLRSEGNLVPLS